MKFFHLSDLHIGKRVDEYSMLDDQRHILSLIINAVDSEKPDAIIIAGDVYDRSDPPAEAIKLFDSFLATLNKLNLSVFIINGNHDSAERISFGEKLFDKNKIYISPVFDGNVKSVTLEDEFGEITFYLLPFLKPAVVNRYLGTECKSYNEAIHAVTESLIVDTSKRNVIVAHQFVTGAQRSDSEDISVGGLDNVDSTAFEKFDYVALGHIHKPQDIGKNTVRYCGSPLKYSLSEAKFEKSITVVEMKKKGNISVGEISLIPKRELREIKGSYLELSSKQNYQNTKTDDYIYVTLTDEEDVIDAVKKLRLIYPNIMKLRYDNKRTRENNLVGSSENVREKSPLELFSELYVKQNNSEMTTGQTEFTKKLIEEVWGEE